MKKIRLILVMLVIICSVNFLKITVIKVYGAEVPVESSQQAYGKREKINIMDEHQTKLIQIIIF